MKDGPRLGQQPKEQRILLGHVIDPRRVRRMARPALEADVLLDRDGHPVQRAHERARLGKVGVQGGRAGQGALNEELGGEMDELLGEVGALEKGGGGGYGGEGAGGHAGYEVGGGGVGEGEVRGGKEGVGQVGDVELVGGG